MAALIGQFFGALAASLGLGYLWLGTLWLLRVYKRWPRFSYWSAAALSMAIALLTAASQATTADAALYLMVGIMAAAFIAWRGRKVAPKTAPNQAKPAAQPPGV